MLCNGRYCCTFPAPVPPLRLVAPSPCPCSVACIRADDAPYLVLVPSLSGCIIKSAGNHACSFLAILIPQNTVLFHIFHLCYPPPETPSRRHQVGRLDPRPAAHQARHSPAPLLAPKSTQITVLFPSLSPVPASTSSTSSPSQSHPALVSLC